jgi:glutamine synthetase
MLKAGMDGIKNQILPPAPVDYNLYEMTVDEREAGGIASLPGDLYAALKELKKDTVVQEALGPHIYDRFMEAKNREWNEYNIQVHGWEIDRYLTIF